ncbi:MAG: hypothetical protein HQL96_12940 [Magnetococcales bacterium]|nr:hypothetical protein [Magnetococcales bacterium]
MENMKTYAAGLLNATQGTMTLPELFALTQAMREAGETHLAVGLYRAWIRHQPEHESLYAAWYNLGACLVELRLHEAASEAFRESITRHDGLPQAHLGLGLVLKELGRIEEAQASLRQAARLLEGDPASGEQARFVHGVLESLVQQPLETESASLAHAIDQALAQDDPERLYAQAVQAHPNGEDALLLLGPWLRALGEPARLTEWLGKAVAMAASRLTPPAADVAPGPAPGRIEVMAFEVVAACHNDCLDCAHGEMRKSSKRYQLSMEQVRRFIQVTEASGYTIGAVNLHGPGEPLLWKHFNEAIPLLKSSPAIESIIVNTTGREMDRVADEVWQYIDRVEMSIYDPAEEAQLVSRLTAKYHNRLNVLPMNLFWERVRKTEVADIPCWCACAGPMLFGDRVYFYCGPPVFDAAALVGSDIDQLDYLSAPLEEHYLARRDPSLAGNLALCRHCWANGNRYAQAKRVKQVTTGGGWQ